MPRYSYYATLVIKNKGVAAALTESHPLKKEVKIENDTCRFPSAVVEDRGRSRITEKAKALVSDGGKSVLYFGPDASHSP